MIKFVLDTYAILGFIDGNPKYKEYLNNEISITTAFNMMEVYYKMLKKFDEESAEHVYDTLLLFEHHIEHETIKNAMKKRLKLKSEGKDISYVDAIGYQLAIELGAKFVTGDKEFEKLENVLFIK